MINNYRAKQIYGYAIAALFVLLIPSSAETNKKYIDSKLVNIKLSGQSFVYGKPIKFDIVYNAGSGISENDIEFQCYVFVENDEEGFVEYAPNLEAVGPKPKDLIYKLSETKTLIWDYTDKPKFFKPVIGKKYAFVIEITEPKNFRMIASLPFTITDKK